MNQTLVNNNYLVVPGFVSKDKVDELYHWMHTQKAAGNLIRDPREYLSLYGYAYQDAVPFLELLCNKVTEVSEIIGEQVLPTYAYSIIYEKNSVLIPHRDREACEISLTLHLGGDTEWPIFIQKPNGTETAVALNPGDAMLYLGCVADHWRGQYSGVEYTQVFMHYVRSNGPNVWAYFDKIR